MHVDDSILRLDRRGFVHHFQPGAWRAPRLFAAQAVPCSYLAVGAGPGGGGGGRVPLAAIVAHAQQLRWAGWLPAAAACCARRGHQTWSWASTPACHGIWPAPIPAPWFCREVAARLIALGRAPQLSPLSGRPLAPAAGASAGALHPEEERRSWPAAGWDPTVVQQQLVPGHGSFKAFGDGRLAASFEDRTLLKLSPCGTTFEALLPSGRLVPPAPVAQAAELAPYVQAAQEYSAWAAASHEERARPAQLQQQVAAHLSSTHRQLALLSDREALSSQAHEQQAPQAAAAAAGGTAEAANEDYMLDLVSSGSMRAAGAAERAAFVEAWLRRNALIIDRL